MHAARRPIQRRGGCHTRRGTVLIWAVLLMMLLIGILGLGIDSARIYYTAQQLQGAADAAALAGALQVKGDEAEIRAAARAVALANTAAGDPVNLDLNEDNDPDGDIVLGRFDRVSGTFTPNTFFPNAVKVVARRTDESIGGPLALIFGPVFGTTTANVARESIAMMGGGTGAGLVVLDETAPEALRISGSMNQEAGFTLRVNGGDIQVNSNASGNQGASNAVHVIGNSARVYFKEMHVRGGVSANANTLIGTVNTSTGTIFPDPMADLPAPTDFGTERTSPPSGTFTQLSPGYYPAGINVGSQTEVFLEPGVYVLGGAGLSLGAGATLSGDGILIYLHEGGLQIQGGATLELTPPDPEDPDNFGEQWAIEYEYVSIFQARYNNATSTIVGQPDLEIEGTCYFPAGRVEVQGTAGNLGTQLILNTLSLSGNAVLEINFDGRQPARGSRVFLVR